VDEEEEVEDEVVAIRRRRAVVTIEVETLHTTPPAEVDAVVVEEVAEEAVAVEKSTHPKGLRRSHRIMLKINSMHCLEGQPRKRRNQQKLMLL